jgi:hypothetical protein
MNLLNQLVRILFIVQYILINCILKLFPNYKIVGNAQVVLIGEASHGTEEFYHERCLITQRLIEEKDFT